MSKPFKRKLVAILSADVQGYSRLMGDDEYETVRTLTAYRRKMSSLVKQHSGRVVDSPGDNMLAEFTSVVDAVECAVEIQKELKAKNAPLSDSRKMEFRIGVNLGDVIDKGRRIYGDGINIAARLESLAEGGGICISRTAYDQVKHKVDLQFEYLGEQRVKNIAEPVRAYRVIIPSETAKPPKPVVTLMSKQKAQVGLYACVTLGIFYLLYIKYLRYFIADLEFLQRLSFINPLVILQAYPILPIALGILILSFCVLLVFIKSLPVVLLRILKGGFYFGIGFCLCFLALSFLPFGVESDWNKNIFESQHLFVEALEKNVDVFKEPDMSTSPLRRVKRGTILLLSDVSQNDGLTWNKILIGYKKYGWVLRVVPPKSGLPERRLTIANKFYFTYSNLVALTVGFVGFIWGFCKYRVRMF